MVFNQDDSNFLSLQNDEKNNVELSSKEIQVLELLACGHENSNIAKELKISIDTVKFHFKSIKIKLNSKNRTHSLAIAIAKKMVSIDTEIKI